MPNTYATSRVGARCGVSERVATRAAKPPHIPAQCSEPASAKKAKIPRLAQSTAAALRYSAVAVSALVDAELNIPMRSGVATSKRAVVPSQAATQSPQRMHSAWLVMPLG